MVVDSTKFIDYHCHILPGLDDGCRDLAESLAMAQVLVAAGFREVYCTPHCMHGVYNSTPALVQSAVVALQQQLDNEGISLKLHPGMEYYLDEYFSQKLDDVQPLGETQLLLVEFPMQYVDPEQTKNQIFQIVRKGYTPVLAHPERYQFLLPQKVPGGILSGVKRLFGKAQPQSELSAPGLLAELQQQGCLLQGNIGSLVGYYGRKVQANAEQFQQAGFYRFWGSDGHHPEPTERFLEKAKGIY